MYKVIGAGAIVVVSGLGAYALMGGAKPPPAPIDVTARSTGKGDREPGAPRVFAASAVQPVAAREPDLIARQLESRPVAVPPAAKPTARPAATAAPITTGTVKPAAAPAKSASAAKKKTKPSTKAAASVAPKKQPSATAAAQPPARPIRVAHEPALN